MKKEVPNTIDNAKTLFIAEPDGVFDVIERDGRKVEIVFVAICQYEPGEGYYLFGCDKNFNAHTDFYYDELENALEDAKRVYDLEHISWRQWLPQ
ncbi:MAG TPA: hypothetical protein VFZ78_06890 [Flavisolibacter sp.]